MARRTKGQQAEHNEMIHAARKKIVDAKVIDMMIDVAVGNPIAEYEPRTSPRQKRGKLKRLVRPTMDHRIRIMKELKDVVLPTLKSVDVGQAGGGMKISIETNGVGIPGQLQRDEAEKAVTTAIEHQVDVLNEVVEAEVIEDDEVSHD